MKFIAALQADLEVAPLGTRSRLADELRGVPILRRTVERLALARSLDAVYVLAPSAQRDRCRRILEGTRAEIVAHDAGPSPWSSLVRSARKWSLDSWRGGIGGATSFDEYCDCRLLKELLERVTADAILVVPAAAALLDPDLTEQMIHRRRSADEEVRLVFSPLSPGLTGILLDADLIRELAGSNLPVGWLFGYQPNAPRKDLIFQACCMEAPQSLRFVSGRLIADTERSTRRLADVLGARPSVALDEIGVWLREEEFKAATVAPREVEIELTTDDPFPNAVLHPRGDRVPSRGPIDLACVRSFAVDLTATDDSLVVLGGFGDPLRHPDFREMLASLRPDGAPGVFGLCVRTRAADLRDATIEAILNTRVDVLNVILDAWTPELFAKLAGPTGTDAVGLEQIVTRIDRLTKLREQRGLATPIVVPEFTKSRLNVHEMDDFFDGWLRRLGAASIVGHSYRAGQVPDLALLNMAPSPREACRRVRSRCLVLADGTVVACDQDFRGTNPLGNLHSHSLGEVWTADSFRRLRSAHNSQDLAGWPLCTACNEWHRP
jgi:hypothetical protein